MSRLSHFVLIIIMNALMCILAKEELYSTEYDDFDIQGLLQNKNLRNEYFNCFMEIAPCKTLEQKKLTGTAIHYSYRIISIFLLRFFG